MTPLALFKHEQAADFSCVSVRCLMAAAPSCPTSTRQLTRCTGRRDWLLPLTDTLWSQTPGTTALKFTATCSSVSSRLAHRLCTLRNHALSCAPVGAEQPWQILHSLTLPYLYGSSRRCAIRLSHLHTSVSCI